MAFTATRVIWAKIILVKDEPAFGGDTKYTFAEFGDTEDDYTLPLQYSIKSGELPPGMELDTATGGVSGTPTSGGTFSPEIQVSDSSDPVVYQSHTTEDYKFTVTLNLVVNPGPDILYIKSFIISFAFSLPI